MKTTKETLQSLLERYQVYAGEYKKPLNLFEEIGLSAGLSKKEVDTFNIYDPTIYRDPDKFNDWCNLVYATLDLFDNNYKKQEFLIHKECFHPDFDLWYACPDTTSIEMVYVIEECLKSLE